MPPKRRIGAPEVKEPELKEPETKLPYNDMMQAHYDKLYAPYVPPLGDPGENFGLVKTLVPRIGKEVDTAAATNRVLEDLLFSQFEDEFPNANIEEEILTIEKRIDKSKKTLVAGQPNKIIRQKIENNIRDDKEMVARLKHGLRVRPGQVLEVNARAALKKNDN